MRPRHSGPARAPTSRPKCSQPVPRGSVRAAAQRQHRAAAGRDHRNRTARSLRRPAPRRGRNRVRAAPAECASSGRRGPRRPPPPHRPRPQRRRWVKVWVLGSASCAICRCVANCQSGVGDRKFLPKGAVHSRRSVAGSRSGGGLAPGSGRARTHPDQERSTVPSTLHPRAWAKLAKGLAAVAAAGVALALSAGACLAQQAAAALARAAQNPIADLVSVPIQ